MWLTAADLQRRIPSQWQAALAIGDEPLLVEESADCLRAAAKADGFDERKVLEVSANYDWDELLAQGSEMSLFAQKQLIELRIPEAKAGNDGSKAIQKFVANQSDDMRLLVIATTSNAPPKKDPAWMVRIAEAGLGVRCRKLYSDQLPGWLKKRAQSLGVEIAQDALVWLAQQVEGNLLAARQELEKLPLLAPGKIWALGDLQAVISDHARYATWDLPDALLRGDLASALHMIERMRGEGLPPVLVVFSMARDIRSLHQAALHAGQVGPDRACATAGIWKSRQPQFVAALRRLGPAGVRRVHMLTVALDHTAKSAPDVRFWEDLVNLAVRLGGQAARPAA